VCFVFFLKDYAIYILSYIPTMYIFVMSVHQVINLRTINAISPCDLFSDLWSGWWYMFEITKDPGQVAPAGQPGSANFIGFQKAPLVDDSGLYYPVEIEDDHLGYTMMIPVDDSG